MEENNKNVREVYIRKKRRQKIAITVTAIIIILVILTFVIPDFWEKSIAFLIVLGIVLFIPFTIWLFFSHHQTFWDKFFWLEGEK